jgi:hypothetical protein
VQPLTDAEEEEYLNDFEDAKALPEWARADAALCVKSGIILGTDGRLSYTSNLTRAQCAAIANRLDRVLVETLLP